MYGVCPCGSEHFQLWHAAAGEPYGIYCSECDKDFGLLDDRGADQGEGPFSPLAELVVRE